MLVEIGFFPAKCQREIGIEYELDEIPSDYKSEREKFNQRG